MTHKIGLPYFKLIRKPVLFQYTVSDLSNLPLHTVGHTLFLFLENNNLQLLPYYEKHDIKHVVLATEKGEVCLQLFMLANGRITLPIIATVLFGICTMPEYWKAFILAFKRGYHTSTLKHINWLQILSEPLISVQQQIFISNSKK